MAKQDFSFDIVSEVSMPEVANAVDQARREIAQRFDFKDTGTSISQDDQLIEVRSSTEDRLKAAVDGRNDDSFVIMARTDAHAVEGQNAAIERAVKYVEAGADMIFAEALSTMDEFKQFTQAVKVPVLANITEFGKTPLFTVQELGSAGVGLVLYPLSAFRAMSKAAEAVYGAIRKEGTQKSVLDRMQTRAELYDVLGYHEYEQKLDELFGREGKS